MHVAIHQKHLYFLHNCSISQVNIINYLLLGNYSIVHPIVIIATICTTQRFRIYQMLLLHIHLSASCVAKPAFQWGASNGLPISSVFTWWSSIFGEDIKPCVAVVLRASPLPCRVSCRVHHGPKFQLPRLYTSEQEDRHAVPWHPSTQWCVASVSWYLWRTHDLSPVSYCSKTTFWKEKEQQHGTIFSLWWS